MPAPCLVLDSCCCYEYAQREDCWSQGAPWTIRLENYCAQDHMESDLLGWALSRACLTSSSASLAPGTITPKARALRSLRLELKSLSAAFLCIHCVTWASDVTSLSLSVLCKNGHDNSKSLSGLGPKSSKIRPASLLARPVAHAEDTLRMAAFPAAVQAPRWSHQPLDSACKEADLLEAWNFRPHPSPGPSSTWPFSALRLLVQTHHDLRSFRVRLCWNSPRAFPLFQRLRILGPCPCRTLGLQFCHLLSGNDSCKGLGKTGRVGQPLGTSGTGPWGDV